MSKETVFVVGVVLVLMLSLVVTFRMGEPASSQSATVVPIETQTSGEFPSLVDVDLEFSLDDNFAAAGVVAEAQAGRSFLAASLPAIGPYFFDFAVFKFSNSIDAAAALPIVYSYRGEVQIALIEDEYVEVSVRPLGESRVAAVERLSEYDTSQNAYVVFQVGSYVVYAQCIGIEINPVSEVVPFLERIEERLVHTSPSSRDEIMLTLPTFDEMPAEFEEWLEFNSAAVPLPTPTQVPPTQTAVPPTPTSALPSPTPTPIIPIPTAVVSEADVFFDLRFRGSLRRSILIEAGTRLIGFSCLDGDNGVLELRSSDDELMVRLRPDRIHAAVIVEIAETTTLNLRVSCSSAWQVAIVPIYGDEALVLWPLYEAHYPVRIEELAKGSYLQTFTCDDPGGRVQFTTMTGAELFDVNPGKSVIDIPEDLTNIRASITCSEPWLLTFRPID